MLATLCAGCVSGTDLSRRHLADELQKRTGAGLREGLEQTAPEHPKGVDLGDGLSVDEAIALALWNNPGFNALLSDLEVSRADMDAAGMLPNPTLSLLFPIGPKQLEAFGTWDIAFLWQRNGRVKMASLRVEEVGARLVQQGLQLARQVHVAHARAHAAKARLRLAQQAATTWHEILRISRARHAVQAANDLELSSVQSDSQMADLLVARLGYALEQAKVDLESLLGETLPTDVHIVVDPLQGELPPIEALRKLAMGARPDVRAAELSLAAAGRAAGVAARDAYRLGLIIDMNGEGLEGFEIGPGLQLPIPIFNRNQPDQDKAQAELRRAVYRYREAKLQVQQALRSATSRYQQNYHALRAWPELVVRPLERNVTLATLSFKAGAVSHLQVLDNTRRLVAAKQEQVEMELAQRIATADLRLSLGTRIHVQ